MYTRDVYQLQNEKLINYIMIMREPIILIVPGMVTNLNKYKLINFSDNAKDLPSEASHIINSLPNASKEFIH
jgi:hypothetical protein